MAKLNKRIEQAIRHRAKVGRPQAEEQVKLIVSDRERDVFTQTHANVLLELETMLAQLAEQISDIDDHLIELGLRSAIRRRPPTDPRAELLVDLLMRMHEIIGVDEEVFRTAMRVVYKSVKTHSDCAPGDDYYVTFVQEWVQRMSNAPRSRLDNLRLED